MAEHCRNWIAGDDGGHHCGKPAEFIVWGKLFDPDALGPRCYDCAAEQIGHHALAANNQRFAYAVYRLPDGEDLSLSKVRERLTSRDALAYFALAFETHVGGYAPAPGQRLKVLEALFVDLFGAAAFPDQPIETEGRHETD